MMCGVGVHAPDLASILQRWTEVAGTTQERFTEPISTISIDLPRAWPPAPGSTSPHSQTKPKLCDLCRVVKDQGLAFRQK